jgi:hypothetical protein
MFIYYKLNRFQENNSVLLTDGLCCILHIFECKKNYFPKKEINTIYMEIIIKKFKDKINDIKFKKIYMKLLYLFINIYHIKNVFDIILNNIYEIKNIIILKEYIIFFKDILEKIKNKNRIKNINIKNLMNFIVHTANISNNSPEIRTLCVNLLCVLYNIYGKIIKEFLLYNNESLFNEMVKQTKTKDCNNYNNLNNEFFDQKNERNNNKTIIGQSKSFMIKSKTNNNSNKKLKINVNNNTRNIKKVVNISKYISPNLLSQLSSGDFESKKRAFDIINALITKYRNGISINGLNDLFFLIKDKINDEDSNYACLILSLLSKLIMSLGYQIKIYSNCLIYPLFLNLSNISQRVREYSFACIQNWIKVQGINIITLYVPELLTDDNKNNTMKLEILNLLILY